MLPHLSAEQRRTFEAAYRRDENAVPAVYVLLSAGAERAADEALRTMLVGAGRVAGPTEVERLPFEGSATHREIQLGLLGTQRSGVDDAGALCAVRRFRGQPQGPEAEQFSEADEERAAQVRRLTAAVMERLPEEQVLRYSVDWRGRGSSL
jgi:hypothetical protein